MPGRLIAISDIHGCSKAFGAVLEAIDPRPADTLITLGDYIDRGPDSQGAMAMLLHLAGRCNLVPLLGNHDEVLLDLVDGETELLLGWMRFGGGATLRSYQCQRPDEIPPRHIDFLRGCRLFHETRRHFFVHGSYHEDIPLEEQPREVLLWENLRGRQPGRHVSGKTAIVGHTSQPDGEILDLGHIKCIDTCCYGRGWLTAMEVGTGRIWQADKKGKIRR